MKKKVALLLVFALVFSSFFSGSAALAAPQKMKHKLNVKKLNMTVGSTFQVRVYNMKKRQKVTYSASKPDITISFLNILVVIFVCLLASSDNFSLFVLLIA